MFVRGSGRRLGAVLALAGTAFLHEPTAFAEPAAPPPGPRAQTTAEGHYFVVYEPRPDPIPLNQLFAVRVLVYDASDHTKRVRDVSVTVGAAMPEHNHGMNTQAMPMRTADGDWVVDGMLFHMAGQWQLMIAVVTGMQVERATFDIRVE